MSLPWQKFLQGKPVEKEVGPVIYRSWQRSVCYNVCPTEVVHDKILTLSSLRELQDKQEDFLRASRSVMPYLFQMLQGSNYSVLLGDRNGYILESVGDGPFMSKAQMIHLSPGGNWSEELVGTNAIGTALAENMPVVVNGPEHFVQQNHFLSCWAAPIHGVDGETIGVIDISGDKGTEARILDITMLGAKMIEQNLRYMDIERQFLFYQQGAKAAIDLLKEGTLSVDRYGHINHINAKGASIIGRKREELIGRHVTDVFSAPKGWSLITSQLDLSLKDDPAKELLTRFKQITDDSGNPIGVIGKLQNSEPTNKYPDYSPTGHHWIGSQSDKSKKVLTKVLKSAAIQSSVLIQGESGTGKEIVARMIHENSSRKDNPFVALNCAALPSTLLESELFGYVDGAFTGARRGGQPGKFEVAHRGTIFLDEIGDMPKSAQIALLRLIQEKEITRIGDKKTQKIDVRVLTATNKDLKSLVDNQTFRLDLFYRLKVITIDLPPLRERSEDIAELVHHFILKTCTSLGLPFMGIEDEVLACLHAYSWPGNIRELENCIEGMVAMCNSSMLSLRDLPKEIRCPFAGQTPQPGSLLSQQNRQTILQALAQTHGKIAPAARLLGISRSTLYRRLDELQIEYP